MENKPVSKNMFRLVIIIVFISLIMLWSVKRDEKVLKAADIYEECVRVEYNGMTPSYYRALHGEYPTCPQQ